MAQLDATPLPPWTAAQSRAQLAAVAWLRWRIFLNSFRYRNKKRSVTSLVLIVVVRILVWGFIALFLAGPILGCGFAAYYRPDRLGMILWVVFSVHFFISLNVVPGAVGFDLSPLLRFPVRFSQYLSIRLFFGLVAIPTIVASLCLAAAAIGIGIARHGLFPWAAVVLGLFALNNIFFLRMVFAWVDRWLATRRAREILGGIVLFLSLGFQFAVSGTRGHHGEHMAALMRLLAPLHPILQYLPPSLAAAAILDRYHSATGAAYASFFGLLAFALTFLAIFAMRLQKEFRGENLSEAGRRPARAESRPRPATAELSHPEETLASSTNSTPASAFRLPSTVAACLEKELIYLKRSGAQLYSLFTPLFFVFIITRTNKTLSNSSMLLPYAVTYMMFGLLANLYNVLGADGPGFNLYLLAPVRLRDVLLAKNLLNTGVIVIEILLAVVAVSLITGDLPPATMLAATLSWAAFAVLVNLTMGNLRSLLAPMRFELGKARRAPMAKGGALISLGVLFGTLGIGIVILLACRYFGHLWLATVVFLLLDAAALFAYLTLLGRVDGIALDHRDDLTEALCKAST